MPRALLYQTNNKDFMGGQEHLQELNHSISWPFCAQTKNTTPTREIASVLCLASVQSVAAFHDFKQNNQVSLTRRKMVMRVEQLGGIAEAAFHMIVTSIN